MRPGGGQSTGTNVVRIFQGGLGANLGEGWFSELGITLSGAVVTSWTGQINGTVLTPAGTSNRPAYGADSANFRGRSVVQTDYATLTGLSATRGSPLGSSGDYGELIVIGRSRVAYAEGGGGQYHIFGVGQQPAANEIKLQLQTGTIAGGSYGLTFETYHNATAWHAFTGPSYSSISTAHAITCSTRDTSMVDNYPRLYSDAVAIAPYNQVIYGAPGQASVFKLGVDASIARGSDYSFAAALYCYNALTQAERVFVRDVARVVWGTP